MNDYYKILGLKYKFTAFDIFKNYCEKCKDALSSNNVDEFVKINMGFEVLRHDYSRDDYNRIYRKEILQQELNFPRLREEQMIANFQEKERWGAHSANELIANKVNYKSFYRTLIFGFIYEDVAKLFIGGLSGLAIIICGFICLFLWEEKSGWIVGSFLALVGFFTFRKNIQDTIMP